MHAIYTTSGFIIGSRPSGEAGKLISIFTRDLGLVFASAQGIRFEKSKLRPFTQDYSFGEFSFVRGKEYWRLIGAGEGSIHEAVSQILSPSVTYQLIARIASLLDRLLHGEESHPELFDCIKDTGSFLADNPNIDAEESQTLESLIVIRILNKLGYIGDVAELNGHIKSSELSVGLLHGLKAKRMLMNQHINKALKESHL